MEGRGLAARSDGKSAVGYDEEDHADMHEDADFPDLPVHFQPLEAHANAHSGRPARTPISEFGVERNHRSLMDTDTQYLDPGMRLTPNYSSPLPPSHTSPQPVISYPNSSSSNYTSPPPSSSYASPPPSNAMDMGGYNPLYSAQNLAGGHHGEGLGNPLPYRTSYHSSAAAMSNPGMFGSSGMNSHFDAGDAVAMAGPSGKSGHQSVGKTYPSADVRPASGGGVAGGRESDFGLNGRSGNKLCSAGVNTVESGSFGLNGQNDKQYHPCPHCSKLFTRRDHMKRHIKIHIRGEPVKCVECQGWFPSKLDLTHHLLDSHHVLVFECNGCSKGFFEAKYLSEHLRNKHDLIEGPDGRMLRAPTSKLPPLPQALQLPYRCGICSLSFVHESALNKHMLCHTKRLPTSSHSPPVSSLALTSGNLSEVRDAAVMSQLWAQSALSHDEGGGGGGHNNNNNNGTNLLAMQALSHGGYPTPDKGTPHFGNGMGIPAFPQNQNLQQPVKSEPGEGGERGERQQKEGFVDVNGHLTNLFLNRALQQHQQQQQQQQQRSDMDMALRMMRCAGSDDFTCGVCGKVFERAPEMKAHLRKHSSHHRFACTQCGASFASSSNLMRHQRTHSGERPFPCSLCPSAFTHKGALINHERIHTGERPYVCELCEAAFARVDALTRHRRTHKENKIKQEDESSSDGVYGVRI